jgi:acyl carrier protein
MDIDRLKSIINEYTGIPVHEIGADMSLRGDMALDSFQIIAMIASIENEFRIVIPEFDIVEFETLKDIADYISEQTGYTGPVWNAGLST